MRNFYALLTATVLLLSANQGFAQPSYDMGNQTVTDTAGYLYDAGGPSGNYYDNDTVTFTINVGAGKTLKFQWLEFNIETNDVDLEQLCIYDYVEIFDGDPTTQLPTERYCGKTLPPNFEVTSGKITIRMITDGGTNLAGFKAYWTTGDYLPTPPPPPAATTTYCNIFSDTPCESSAIKRFAMANIDNDNDICDKDYDGINDDGYSDYTNLLVQLRPDSVYLIQGEIIQSLFTDHIQVWIDWNNDTIWDQTERTQLVGEGNETNMFVAPVVVPPNAVVGKVGRIRVISEWLQPAVDPCTNPLFGEVEDYSFIILDGQKIPACVNYATAIPKDSSINNCLHQTLQWDKAADATSYLVSLIDTLTGTKIVDNYSVTDTFYVVPTTLAPNTAYRWIALAVNGTTKGFFCDSADFTTSNIPDPMVSIMPNGTPLQACLNTPLNLNGTPTLGTAPYTHSWTGTGATKLNNALIVNPVFTGNTTGTFKLIYTVKDANKCTVKDSVDIEVITEVNAGTLTAISPSPACQGSPISLGVTGYSGTLIFQDSIAGGSWTDMASTQVNASTFTVNESSTGTVYFRTRAVGSNCSAIGTTVLTYIINAAPAAPMVTLVGNDTICDGSSMKLVVTNYTSNLVWNDAASTQNDTLVVLASGTYKVTYTGASCPSTSTDNKILVAPMPLATIQHLGNLTTCSDNLPFLYTDPSDSETVLWNTGAITKGIYANASGNYSALITNEFGCSKVTPTLAVTINAVPVKPVITQIGSANPCEGEPVTLRSNYVGGNAWSTGATADSIIVTSSGNYAVTYTNAAGCFAKSDTTKLIFRPAPVRPHITTSGTLNTCNGDSITLNVSTTPVSTWNTGLVNNTLVVYTSGKYYAHYINSDGCSVYSDTAIATFTQLQPKMKINIASNNFCQGNPVLLTVNIPEGNTWNDALATQNDSLVVTQNGNFFVKNVMYNVCVAYSDTVNITFLPKPATPSITRSNDTLYCSVTASAYQWIGNEGPISNSNHKYYVPTNTGNYSVTVYSAQGCASDPSSQYYIGFTGIIEQHSAKVEISPNPFDGYININKVESNNAHFTITNQIGQVVAQGKLKQGENTITVDLSSGMYSLMVTDNGKFAVVQVMKK